MPAYSAIRHCCPPQPKPAAPTGGEPLLAPDVAARAQYGALAAAAGSVKGRTVHQTSSKELVKVLGHAS
ncbi:hypothetical protein GCM10027074_08250 [Streptomyces deserti]